jgi:hypothetical protein
MKMAIQSNRFTAFRLQVGNGPPPPVGPERAFTSVQIHFCRTI